MRVRYHPSWKMSTLEDLFQAFVTDMPIPGNGMKALPLINICAVVTRLEKPMKHFAYPLSHWMIPLGKDSDNASAAFTISY